MENSLVIPHRVIHSVAIDLVIPLSGIYTEEMKAETQTDAYITMFIEAFFTIAKGRNNPSAH
jgi:hypothetical protein